MQISIEALCHYERRNRIDNGTALFARRVKELRRRLGKERGTKHLLISSIQLSGLRKKLSLRREATILLHFANVTRLTALLKALNSGQALQLHNQVTKRYQRWLLSTLARRLLRRQFLPCFDEATVSSSWYTPSLVRKSTTRSVVDFLPPKSPETPMTFAIRTSTLRILRSPLPQKKITTRNSATGK